MHLFGGCFALAWPLTPYICWSIYVSGANTFMHPRVWPITYLVIQSKRFSLFLVKNITQNNFNSWFLTLEPQQSLGFILFLLVCKPLRARTLSHHVLYYEINGFLTSAFHLYLGSSWTLNSRTRMHACDFGMDVTVHPLWRQNAFL